MFKKIIVATDLSEASYALTKCLAGLKEFGAEECLLLQCISKQEAASIYFSYVTAVIEEHLRNLKEIVENQGYIVESRVVPGVARNEVNNIAKKENYSLIVVGAQEHFAASEILFEGLAYDIIHHACKPVLIIRMEKYQDKGLSCIKSIGCNLSNHILFPTDFSENAELAFEYVKGMVAKGVKEVTLVHIQDELQIGHYLKERLEEFNAIDKSRLQNMKQLLEDIKNVEVKIIMRYGSSTVELLKLIRELNIQLVVMGSQGRGFVKEVFLGSVSHNMARHSPASILLVPAKRNE